MMATKRKTTLTEAQKAFVVQCLACFDTPRETAQALMEEFGVHLAPQNAEAYDPTKRAGKHLSQKWRDLFEQTRKDFLENAESYIPIANKTVRLREMQKAYQAYKGRGNWAGAMQVLEQAAKEMGNVHTNRREISGRDGEPIEYADMTDEELDARLAQLLQAAGVEVVDESGDQADAGGASNSVH